jgi:hypothetical protein
MRYLSQSVIWGTSIFIEVLTWIPMNINFWRIIIDYNYYCWVMKFYRSYNRSLLFYYYNNTISTLYIITLYMVPVIYLLVIRLKIMYIQSLCLRKIMSSKSYLLEFKNKTGQLIGYRTWSDILISHLENRIFIHRYIIYCCLIND